MTDREFDNLTQVVTYDEWIVSTDNNGKYYVKDNYMDEIKEVVLVHKEKNDIFSDTMQILNILKNGTSA